MSKELVRAIEYSVISFASTHHALAAEKLVKDYKIPFILIPTPREISASCGLSLKIHPEDKDRIAKILSQHNITPIQVHLVINQSGTVKYIKM